jgi:hypothetical protein
MALSHDPARAQRRPRRTFCLDAGLDMAHRELDRALPGETPGLEELDQVSHPMPSWSPSKRWGSGCGTV